MESTIGLYTTELIKPRRPWRTQARVELATAEWIGWYNNQRLHSAIGHVPPTEYESMFYAQPQPRRGGWSQQLRSPQNPGAVHSPYINPTLRARGACRGQAQKLACLPPRCAVSV
ncbi:integrase core domain-containing protein [Micromonospora sp. CB01531]|uniref:integrase core domain-containing protein n=1 Tax=Micromonospora sp. CB01531 TaxID=1718947 RepID=UPI0009FA0399